MQTISTTLCSMVIVLIAAKPVLAKSKSPELPVEKALSMFAAPDMTQHFSSYSLDVESKITVMRGVTQALQDDRFLFERDDLGSTHGLSRTERDRLEITTTGNETFVRHGKGPMRRVSREDTDITRVSGLAFASLGQTLALFNAYAEAPSGRRVGSRTVRHYTITSRKTPIGPLGVSLSPPSAAWRTNRVISKLQGHLDVDEETGLIIGAEIKGTLRSGDNTDISVRYVATVEKINSTPRIRPPVRHDEEYEAPTYNHQPVKFFEPKS